MPDDRSSTPLHTDALTWTALLGQWMDFARASLAVPAEADGDRWRASVVSVITLQAVTMALGQLDRLCPADRAVSRDRAAVLIAEHGERLRQAWSGADQPVDLKELADDVARALERSAYCGAIELIWNGPGELVMPELDIPADLPTVAAMQPGTLVMQRQPVAWWIGEPALVLNGCTAEAAEVPRQVYRQLDDDGRITGDVIEEVTEDVTVGLPLIVPLRWQGETIGRFTMDAMEWEARQRAAMNR